MKVVLDANVFASGVLGLTRFENTPGELLRRWLDDDFELLMSGHLLAEVKKTLVKPHFSLRIALPERQRALAILDQRSKLVEIAETVEGVATHPEDDLVLATAVSGKVDILVTGDRQLQSLGQFRGIPITPRHDMLDTCLHSGLAAAGTP